MFGALTRRFWCTALVYYFLRKTIFEIPQSTGTLQASLLNPRITWWSFSIPSKREWRRKSHDYLRTRCCVIFLMMSSLFPCFPLRRTKSANYMAWLGCITSLQVEFICMCLWISHYPSTFLTRLMDRCQGLARSPHAPEKSDQEAAACIRC